MSTRQFTDAEDAVRIVLQSWTPKRVVDTLVDVPFPGYAERRLRVVQLPRLLLEKCSRTHMLVPLLPGMTMRSLMEISGRRGSPLIFEKFTAELTNGTEDLLDDPMMCGWLLMQIQYDLQKKPTTMRTEWETFQSGEIVPHAVEIFYGHVLSRLLYGKVFTQACLRSDDLENYDGHNLCLGPGQDKEWLSMRSFDSVETAKNLCLARAWRG